MVILPQRIAHSIGGIVIQLIIGLAAACVLLVMAWDTYRRQPVWQTLIACISISVVILAFSLFLVILRVPLPADWQWLQHKLVFRTLAVTILVGFATFFVVNETGRRASSPKPTGRES